MEKMEEMEEKGKRMLRKKMILLSVPIICCVRSRYLKKREKG
jgi:hypothetical protein